MPRVELQDRQPEPVVEAPPTEAPSTETPPRAPSIRRPDGNLSRFDEIVTPHPVVAFLFRRRTLIVLIGILCLVWFSKPRPEMLLAGVGLAALAEAWRIWAAGTIHKTEQLTTGGPYAYVRHPLYVGSFIHSIAYCLFSGRWESFLFVPPLFFLLYGAAVSTEEAMLRKLFPGQYEEYSQRVPRFIPRLWGQRNLGHGSFSWQQVHENKEYVNVIWVVGLTSLFVIKLFWGQ